MANWIEKPIARIWSRNCGEGDGLLVGSLLHSGADILEENTIYELVENQISGDIILRKKGRASIRPSGTTLNDTHFLSLLHHFSNISSICEEYQTVMSNKISLLCVYETTAYVSPMLLEQLLDSDYDETISRNMLIDMCHFAKKQL